MQDTLLITIDSLRADHVSHLGYERDTTPNIDKYAAQGTTFTNAFAHACSTRPSFPSILTSTYATMYGGYERVSDEQTVVSEVFHDAGYRTAGFHSNLYLSADFGYDRGFDTFFDSKTHPSPTARLRQAVKDRLNEDGVVYQTLARAFEVAERQAGANIGSAYVTADEITDMGVEWIQEADNEQPNFLWVHYMDVHHPYVPPVEQQLAFRDEPIDKRRAIRLRRKMLEEPGEVTSEELSDIIDLYDAEIRFSDTEIGRLVESARDVWGDVNVMVTSDHGEEFTEHGRFSHQNRFYDEAIHVPLVFDDGEHDGEHNDLVGLLDVSPTLVDSAGLNAPENFHGESLQRLFDGDWDRNVHIADWKSTNTGEKRFAYRDHEWKYIRRGNEEELFYLPDDPMETENVISKHESIADRCQAVIREHEREVEVTDVGVGEVEMEEGVKKRLRQLGYRE
ncbi:sulfatase [Halorarum halophilum]|uniref:Sulfatase n=1 Tax=Halorarum halophilum TaxID=2743090 RepID=A0A7D5KDE4_9EURY|nr:sulfatase [Halobaculum halophilum]QLG26096.1 sulfatase [Halobaculum halophilum]